MEAGATITVSTGREHRSVNGGDSTIQTMPSAFNVDVGDQQPALAVAQSMDFLRELAEAEAAKVGEELHRADFVVTTDPEVVWAMGSCTTVPTARTARLRPWPSWRRARDQEMLVGQVFWAGPVIDLSSAYDQFVLFSPA